MKQKLYSFLGLLIGFGGLFLSLAAKKYEGNMYLYILIGSLIVIIVSALELKYLFSKKKKQPDEPPINEKELPNYKRKGSVMTRAEAELYRILKEMFSDKYEVLPQVALNSVIDKLTQNSYRSELFRIADYCLIDKETFAPLLLVELNDSSHNRADRIERDKKVSLICERAGLPLVTLTMQDLRNVPQIRRTVLRNILKK